MENTEQRRTRLAQLLDLAQTYKGWTRKDLAKALGRDPTKLIPGSGIPKLDFVVDLASVLEWPVGDVVGHLWSPESSADSDCPPQDFEAIDEAARDAHRSGAYRLMVELGKKGFDVATSAEDRARACNREAGGWDGLGRFTDVLQAVQRGLLQQPVSAEFRRRLQVNLANAYYSLWSLIESRAIASELLSWYLDNPPTTTRDRITHAFAHYVCGHSYRRLISVDHERTAQLAEAAIRHLSIARDLYQELASDLDDSSFEGIASTCHGGILESEVELGRRTAEEALSEFVRGLETAGELGDALVGDRLESYGWWCIFGCNIALRHLSDERQVQQYMAVFTNKADEIAEQLDNWSMRERVFTMEHSRWERAVGCTGFDIPRVVDEDDVRVITGTMARFPTFQSTGWQILQSARVVRAS